MDNIILKQKLKAVGTHLGISLTIFAALLYLIVFHWYPQPFFAADGGWQGIRIIIAVDLVLGPFLTAIVYRKPKRGLVLDLTLIGLVQLTALVWGIHTVYGQRPVLVVFAEARMYTVTAQQLPQTGLSIEDVRRFGKGLPTVVSRLPSKPAKRAALYAKSLRTGHPIYLMGKLYKPLNAASIDKLNHSSINVEAVVKSVPTSRSELREFLTLHRAQIGDYTYLPLFCRYRVLIAIIDPKSGKILDAVDAGRPKLVYPPAPGLNKQSHGTG